MLGFLVACIVFDFTLALKQGNLVGSLNLFMLLILLGRFERGHAAALRVAWAEESKPNADPRAASELPA